MSFGGGPVLSSPSSPTATAAPRELLVFHADKVEFAGLVVEVALLSQERYCFRGCKSRNQGDDQFSPRHGQRSSVYRYRRPLA